MNKEDKRDVEVEMNVAERGQLSQKTIVESVNVERNVWISWSANDPMPIPTLEHWHQMWYRGSKWIGGHGDGL